MKRIIIALAGAAALAGCANGYGYGGYAVGYDAYYDDAYGPFYDGYWGRDGFFYYSAGPRGHYVRDRDHHFRRDLAGGFHDVHGHGPGRGGDRHRR